MIKKFLFIGFVAISLPAFCMVKKNASFNISSFSKSLIKACSSGNINEAINILKQNSWNNVFKIFGLNKNKIAKTQDIYSLFGKLFNLNLDIILNSEEKRQLLLPFLNTKDENGKTFLIEACEKEIHKLVEVLLDCQVDINAQDVSGCTALTKALKTGNKAIIKLLLNKGAAEGIPDDEPNESVTNDNLHQHKCIELDLDNREKIGDIKDLPIPTQTSQESVLYDLVNECEDVLITNERDVATLEIAKVKVLDVEKNYTGQDGLGILLIVESEKESIDKIFCLSSNREASSLDVDLYIKDEFDNMAFIDTFKDYNEKGLYLFLEKGPDVNFLYSSGKTVSIVAKNNDKDKIFDLINKKTCFPVLSTKEFVDLYLLKFKKANIEENEAKLIDQFPDDDNGISTDTDEEKSCYEVNVDKKIDPSNFSRSEINENNLKIENNCEIDNTNENSVSEMTVFADFESLEIPHFLEKPMDFEQQSEENNDPNAPDIMIDEFNFVMCDRTDKAKENQSETESENETDTEFAINFATEEEIAKIKNLSTQANNKTQNKKTTQKKKRKRSSSNIKLRKPVKKIRKKKSKDQKYQCDQCDKSYSDATGLKRHVKGIHGDGFDCKICNKKIGTYGQLMHHQKQIHKKS